MRILWICNLVPRAAAEALGLPDIHKEGWVSALYESLIRKNQNNISEFELIVAFPMSAKDAKRCGAGKFGVMCGDDFYGFVEDTTKESVTDPMLEERFAYIFEDCAPDIVHIFGTEYPHTLAAARALNDPSRLLIGLQGICTEYAERYLAHLPEDVILRHTLRDTLKKDSIYEQQQKFFVRAENEREALKLTGNVAGRTSFDKEYAARINPDAKYHHAGENLRRPFYSGAWNEDCSERFRIFASQGDYPIKGLHYLLIAVGELLWEIADKGRELPDIRIYVAGQQICCFNSVIKKIKISSYGKYIEELIDKYGLRDRVIFTGRLDAKAMKEQYLKCDTYVCCSVCENSPNSLGEAMMLQVPIVTAMVGGIPSIFREEKDGFSFSIEDDDTEMQVADKLKKALMRRWNSAARDNSPSGEFEQRRHNAGFHAREIHTPDKNVFDLLEIYRTMASY